MKPACDEQLKTAINDLLNDQPSGEIALFDTDDLKEAIDYQSSFLRSRSKPVDSADIKNCYILKDNKTLVFSFEWSIPCSHFPTSLKPSFSKVSTMEWYLNFGNSLLPSEFNMGYQIAARIEPTVPSWEIGNGLFENIQLLLQKIRNHELTSYKKTAYLWIRPPGQEMFCPIELQTGNVTFNSETNRIDVVVSRQELSKYGIPIQYGSFEIPAKLTNFSAGVRYYQTPLLHRPGGHIVINTSYLFEKIQRLQSRSLMSTHRRSIVWMWHIGTFCAPSDLHDYQFS